jgi:hypothetical protein
MPIVQQLDGLLYSSDSQQLNGDSSNDEFPLFPGEYLSGHEPRLSRPLSQLLHQDTTDPMTNEALSLDQTCSNDMIWGKVNSNWGYVRGVFFKHLPQMFQSMG